MSGDRCVLWQSPAAPPDAELLGALQRKGLAVEAAAGAYDAMARICVAAADRPGREPAGAAVLLLCDPDLLPGPGEVVRLLDRYAPRAKTWVFDSMTRRLRAATDEDAARWNATSVRVTEAAHPQATSPAPVPPSTPTPGHSPRPTPAPAPALRLSGRGTLPPQANGPAPGTPDKPGEQSPASHDEGPASPGTLLTDEELAMLLSPDGPMRHN